MDLLLLSGTNKKFLSSKREGSRISRQVDTHISLKNINESKKFETITSAYTDPTPELRTFAGIKLGWIQGVLVPCLLNIWGVMLFLRIAWVVAQAGIALTMCIITLSGVVCVITTLSLSAICTNGHLKGGGVYYLVSRTLGAELGASVGIIFAFANAVAASMNTIGFCDSFNELLKSQGMKIIDNDVNDVRIVGAFALFIMCLICAIGMDWETKTQNFLITVIVLAIINFIIGSCLGPTDDREQARGFVGISMETAVANWDPDFRFSEGRDHDFFSVFAVYFPAVTGVQAGANICGDLREPGVAIPRGTLLALAISLTSYFIMALLSGVAALRDASGSVADLTNGTLDSCKPNCEYGLHNSYSIMHLMALWSPLLYGGCWAATLSTALTNLLSVPRLIQALGVDRIYPGLIFFSKRYGRHGEPYRGYVLTFFVSLLFLLIADLNTIAPLITNFYLASYALINFCTFHAAIVHQISWRPTFKYYAAWLSFVGFLMCLTIMMIISWLMMLVTVFIFITLYLFVLYNKPDASWGSSTDAQRYHVTVTTILSMSAQLENIKSYHPQLLVLAGKPYLRPQLLDLGHLITKIGSFMIVAEINHTIMSATDRGRHQELVEEWLRQRKHRAFFVLLQGFELERGAVALMETAGLGRLSPNLLLLGYKYKWTTSSSKNLNSYVHVIQLAFEHRMTVAILRCGQGVPSRAPVTRSGGHITPVSPKTSKSMLATVMNADSELDVSNFQPANEAQSRLEIRDQSISTLKIGRSSMAMADSEKLQAMLKSEYTPFTFTESSNLDAWWLYDDGGMNILLPYIIARRGTKKMHLRIFALVKESLDSDAAEKLMKTIMAKYRLHYTQLTIIPGIGQPPTKESWDLFHSLITQDQGAASQSDKDKLRQNVRTSRHLRLRELMLENSSQAALIVMTLPAPRKCFKSASLYMAWLEVMSRDLPPVLFVRGNDNTVLDE